MRKRKNGLELKAIVWLLRASVHGAKYLPLPLTHTRIYARDKGCSKSILYTIVGGFSKIKT